MKPTPRTRRNSKLLYHDSGDEDASIGSTFAVTKPRVRRGSKSSETAKAIQMRRTIKERKLRSQHVFNGGKWSQKERLDFLRGLRKFGPGKWKDVQTILTTR